MNSTTDSPTRGRNALIGHTGFVGSNVAAKHTFDDVYNTSNIDQIAGREYSLVVSAAGRADSHRINQHPEGDLAELERYAELMSTVSIETLVHISTVCVFDATDRCDERTICDPAELTPYGRNRLWLERTLAARFDSLSLRLPQLFGPGMRKGIVYDLANDYRVEFIDPNGVFQYYDLTRLWSDIETALGAGLSVLNVATEPIENRRLASEVFEIDISANTSRGVSPFANMYTRNMITAHGEVFTRTGDYLMSAAEVIELVRRSVNSAVDGDVTS